MKIFIVITTLTEVPNPIRDSSHHIGSLKRHRRAAYRSTIAVLLKMYTSIACSYIGSQNSQLVVLSSENILELIHY